MAKKSTAPKQDGSLVNGVVSEQDKRAENDAAPEADGTVKSGTTSVKGGIAENSAASEQDEIAENSAASAPGEIAENCAETERDEPDPYSYIVDRANAEGRIPLYLKQELKNKHTLEECVSTIMEAYWDFLDLEYPVYTSDDVTEYIVEKTSYAAEIIELVLWFNECQIMMDGDCLYYAVCPDCGNSKFYMKEREGVLYEVNFECTNCSQMFDHEELEGSEDFEDFDFEDYFSRVPTSKPRKDTEDSYVFKVSLSREIWRKIQISTGDRLDDLSDIILDAFDFENDHLYAFYIDSKYRRRNVPVYFCPEFSKAPSADGLLLEEMGLIKGSKFLFLFDFGDEWHFKISLTETINQKTPKAIVVKSQGEAPLQYPDFF